MTRTPSGGFHLWYRHAGEQSGNLRSESLEVDIKGVGGFVVVPPSIARKGEHVGMPYVFERGSWNELAHLPNVRPGSLKRVRERDNHLGSGATASAREIPKGRRNNTLFRQLLRHAPHCDTLEALYDVAHTLNDSECEEPLSSAEIEKIADSVWSYEQRGDNWVGREARAQITTSELGALSSSPDALVLLIELRLAHRARSGPFAIAPKAMAQHEKIPGWRHPRRYQNARDELIRQGFLARVREGGSAPGDPHLFRLCSPAVAVRNMGARQAPNITKHPPPWASLAQDDQASAFGRKACRWRLEAGLSQAETARRAGVGRSTISNIETGRALPSTRTRRLLEAVFAKRHAA
jgi:DNA-binding XRE family transcriptional regulator